MKYSLKELGFILYNNRSTELVNKFLTKKMNPFTLIKIEKELKSSKEKFVNDSRMVEVHRHELIMDADDIIYTPEDLESLTELFEKNVNKFSEDEYDYLIKRGIKDSLINKKKLFGLSQINDEEILKIMGATTHPVLENVLTDGIELGGIVIPLFEDGKLTNCAVRKIAIENTDKKSLKYTLACPDIPVWGLDNIEIGDEIWLTEGIFDMFAVQKIGHKCVSSSSAMWSGIQIYKVLEKKPKKINIFSDDDVVGIRTSLILKDLFNSFDIYCEVYKSKNAKDASEHIFQKKQDLGSIIEVTEDDILLGVDDESFDFLNHLKNRKM
jgi:hypothetical protein